MNLYKTLTGSILGWLLVATAVSAAEPYPNKTYWERYLHGDEFAALDEMMSQIANPIDKSKLSPAYVEYKTLRRMRPEWSHSRVMNFFYTGQPFQIKAQLLAQRRTLYLNSPKYKEGSDAEKVQMRFFAEHSGSFCRELFATSRPTVQRALAGRFEQMFEKWGSQALPGWDPFVPVRNLREAETALSYAQKQVALFERTFREGDWRIGQERMRVVFLRREVQRLSAR